MGNQLTGVAPSQILPVEHYLTDIADWEFDASLGSTRFFKVARARGREGLAVVKVFVIHDPSLPLKSYRDQVEAIRESINDASNCLPFQNATLSEKAALLFRQYVKDSLYDRISTRPFLNLIEKKWLAFQLLCALDHCHKLEGKRISSSKEENIVEKPWDLTSTTVEHSAPVIRSILQHKKIDYKRRPLLHITVCHGDVKSENVMVTSWNWILLSDFASFKPTYLPDDNPADFSYFFDTSRRRTCYIAPERFVETGGKNAESAGQTTNIDLTDSEVKKGDLTPAMDIFSAGCVIAELFTEGCPPFDLSQLLAYRTGEYSPWKVIQKLEDPHIREMARHMMEKDPARRFTAEGYLSKQRGKAFPEYFYTFLKYYLQRFASSPLLTPDDRVCRIKRDLSLIFKNLEISDTDPSSNTVLVLIISLLSSCLRELHCCSTKLTALEIMLTLSKYVTADIVLDRLIPYMLHFVNDDFPRVRAEALRTITLCLANVRTVPISDANIFPEYILPHMTHLAQDPVVIVRVAYAENIAMLAETALRFLEIVQLNNTSDTQVTEDSSDTYQCKASYDNQLQGLHEMIQQKVVTLLSDPDNIVKETLLSNGITRLCVFFGRQKANDILLSHMITFLNDKYDWYLRAAFFESIVGVAAYAGWQSSSILKPLLEQGLSDTEELVIHKTLVALKSMTELGLLQKPVLQEHLAESVPFLCHPNVWVRQGAVGYVSAVARALNVADVYCNLLPNIQPFIKHPIVQVDKEVVLLNALQPPISRAIYDYILRSSLIDKLFDSLLDRQRIRQNCRPGHKPNYNELDDSVSQLFRKLISQGLTAADEDKLLALQVFMLKLHHARASSTDSTIMEDEMRTSGIVQLERYGKNLVLRQEELFKQIESKTDGLQPPLRRTARRRHGAESPTVLMNEDWKQMFGSTDEMKSQILLNQQKAKLQQQAAQQQEQTQQQHSQQPAVPTQQPVKQTSPSRQVQEQSSQNSSPSHSLHSNVSSSSGSTLSSAMNLSMSQVQAMSNVTQKAVAHYAQCEVERYAWIKKKRDKYVLDQATREIMDGGPWDAPAPPAGWRPKGLLVAHLHEHKGAVNRIRVSQDYSHFATCSNDGTVKIYQCSRMESKSFTNRSRYTYNKQGGQIKTLTFCQASQSLASASDSGSIHVFRMDNSSPRVRILHTKNIDVESEGLIVDMTAFDTGSQNIVTYATVHGLIIGWDLRSDKVAWQLKNNPKDGLITSFDVHPGLSWLAVGTSSGTHLCWDMRFQLPITSVTHPCGSRVRRLVTHPLQQSWLLSSVQGNNEVSMWELETGARQKTLWASSAPPLSQRQASSHSVNGMYVGTSNSTTFLLTAGSDMRMRYWDITYPPNSHIVAGAASDPVNRAVVSYRSRLIEGTEVIQETYGQPRGLGNDDIPRKGPDTPASGHHDVISDITICQTSQRFIITSSRDGVVKVWK